MEVFNFAKPQEFLRYWVSQQAKEGRGQFKKMAEHIGVSTVYISQFMAEKRDLSMDHAYGLSEFCGLTGLNKRYFLVLAQLSRAAEHRYESFLKLELDEIKKEAGKLKHKLKNEIQLSPEDLTLFYSDWVYSAVRMLLPILQSTDKVALRLGLEKTRIMDVCDFLTRVGLVYKKPNHGYVLGPARTHLPAKSNLIIPRQLAWRSKAQQAMYQGNTGNLFFTAPMSVSKKDHEWIQKKLKSCIEDIALKAEKSKEEDLYCLNIDSFKV